MSLWDIILPVVQGINTNGGNFTSMFLNRSVLDLIDQAAISGDAAAVTCRDRIVKLVDQGNGPRTRTNSTEFLRIITKGCFTF
jgi:hypothetical protein